MKARKPTKNQRLKGYLREVYPCEAYPTITYIGIDPGWSGAITFLTFPQEGRGRPSRGTGKMPKDEAGIYESLRYVVRESSCVACIEKVSGFIGTAHTGASMFKFGHNYGACRTALAANNFREGSTYHSPTPQEWQAALGLSPRKTGEKDAGWKARIKLHLFTLVPWQDFPVASADSVAIAIYCALLFGGDQLRWPADWGVSRLKEKIREG